MREWLLIFCATQICSGDLSAVHVSEGQCREAVRIAREMVELGRGEVAVGARSHIDGARAICISPDGRTRLDSRSK